MLGGRGGVRCSAVAPLKCPSNICCHLQLNAHIRQPELSPRRLACRVASRTGSASIFVCCGCQWKRSTRMDSAPKRTNAADKGLRTRYPLHINASKSQLFAVAIKKELPNEMPAQWPYPAWIQKRAYSPAKETPTGQQLLLSINWHCLPCHVISYGRL